MPPSDDMTTTTITATATPVACKLDEGITSTQAARTALETPTDQELRIPCYCEENVWRLAYRKLMKDCDGGGNNNNTMYDRSYFAVFVSNQRKCVPMFQQQAADGVHKACLWDYHVILLEVTKRADDVDNDNNAIAPICCSLEKDDDDDKSQEIDANNRTCNHNNDKTPGEYRIYDIDSRLPYPCSLQTYLEFTFPSDVEIPADFNPMFRVVKAESYLKTFSSDRMHMYDATSQTWSAPPPPYDIIQLSSNTRPISNLMQYVDMSESEASKENREVADVDGFGTVYTLERLQQKFLRHKK